MRILPVSVLALLLAACVSAAPGGGITYDPCQPLVVAPAADTSPAQLQAIQRAIAMWNASGVSQLTLQDAPGAARVPVQFKDGPEPFHGVYEPDVGDVIVNSKVTDPTEAAVVVAHELGHAMALQHISKDERASVMNPDNLSEPPTPADDALLSSVWNHCAAN